jgi:hypothetical protein
MLTRITAATPNPDTISFPAWSDATALNTTDSGTVYLVFTFTDAAGWHRGHTWGNNAGGWH